MRRIFSMLIGAVLAIVLVVVVSGQEGTPGAVTGEGQSATLTVQQSFPVSASVTVDVNGEIYLLTVPVMISLDTQALLTDATVASPSISQVGVVNWVITGIDEYTDEYDLTEYRTYEPSNDENKLVAVSSQVTNLDDEPFAAWPSGIESVGGFDAAGKRYDHIEYLCEDINPGATQTCVYLFDVPKSVTLVGLDLAVIDRKSIRFNP